MESRDIYITKFDLHRLKELVDVSLAFKEQDRGYLESLQHELDRAHIVEPAEVPHDVVTMNSRVRLRNVETGEETVYTLVFPAEAKIQENRLSVLAPIGTAILGYRVGDTVDWQVPAGTRTVRIEEILYQPEAVGHYDR